MVKRQEIDKKFNDLSKTLSKDKSLSEELAQLSEIIDDVADIEEGTKAKWPYVGAKPISESAWEQ